MALADTFYIKQFLGWDIILVTAGSLFSFNWSLIFVISACYAIVVVVSAVAMLKIKVSAVFLRGFWMWLPYTNVCISDRYSIFIFAIKSFVKRVLLYEILALFSVFLSSHLKWVLSPLRPFATTSYLWSVPGWYFSMWSLSLGITWVWAWAVTTSEQPAPYSRRQLKVEFLAGDAVVSRSFGHLFHFGTPSRLLPILGPHDSEYLYFGDW